MPQTVAIPMEVQRRSAAAVIGELQEELAWWRRRAEVAESRVPELVQENEKGAALLRRRLSA
jgi:hypothetical protein